MRPGRLLALLVVLVCHTQAAVAWKEVLKQPASWYATPEAAAVGVQVLAYQFPSGGWPKNRDMTLPPAQTLPQDGKSHKDITHATIDNDATTTQIELLARLANATHDPRFTAAVYQGIHYLLDAQYPNGGWPQFFPEPEGYAKHITFNDDAMVNVLSLLRDVSTGREPYTFIEENLRERARKAVEAGNACILACQIVRGGKRTAWCAQHDELTLLPAPARKFEPASTSGFESVAIVRYLMEIKKPGPEVIEAIEGAIAWFRAVEIHGIRLDQIPAPGSPHDHDVQVVTDSQAPPLWARFYELGTDVPIFSDRDSIIRYHLSEIGLERRSGYNWYVTAPEKLLTRDYPKWKKRLAEQP